MKPERILLIGTGGHALACIDVIEQEGRFAIVGLVGQPHERGLRVLGYPILGTDDDLPRLLRDRPYVLIAVGQIKSPESRIRLFEQACRIGCQMPVVISPRAHVSRHAEVGEGTIIMHGAIVNASARVGRNCIINSLALVEHGVRIGDHCHISTAAAINGGVQIGNGTFIGSGSRIRQSLTIGDHCLIGMGQCVLEDCADNTWLPISADSR